MSRPPTAHERLHHKVMLLAYSGPSLHVLVMKDLRGSGP